MTTPSLAVTTRTYTSNGLLKKETGPEGTRKECVYDLFGRLVYESKNGITSTIEYNDSAHVQVHAQGEAIETRQYDARGNLITLIDMAGGKWTRTYDSLDRLKSEITPEGDTTTWSYQGDSIICKLPSGEKTLQRYEAGVLVESQTFAPDGTLIEKRSCCTYPEQGITEETVGDMSIKTWVNTLGLPVRIQQGDKVTQHYYDPCGNCVATMDGEGKMSRQEFDPQGRVAKKILPDGAVIEYGYDADSNLIFYRMPGNLTWKTEYDSKGRKISEWQEADDGQKSLRWQYAYENDLLNRTTDPLGRIHLYEYDQYARLIAERVGEHTRTYTYDLRGLITSATQSGVHTSKVERGYDADGRLVREAIHLDGELVQLSEQSWSTSGRTLRVGEHKRDFHYQAGRLKTLKVLGMELAYEYGTSGSLTGKRTPYSSLDIQYNHSALPEQVDVQIKGIKYCESLRWTSGGKLESESATYPGANEAAYTYTSRGYLKSCQEENNVEENYVFDFDRPGRGIRTGAPGLQAEEKGTDSFGRIIKENAGSNSLETKYDEMGQVLVHGKHSFVWDVWGRLIAAKSDTYEWEASYDAFGRRLKTSNTPLKPESLNSREESIIATSFYDPEQEFQEIGVSYGDQVYWMLQGVNGCDAVVDDSGKAAVLHHDMRNNLIAVVTAEEILWNDQYPQPFGPRGPPAEKPEGLLSFARMIVWQSKRVDPTGLIWLGARYYDPEGGRFLSPDPVSYPACVDLYAYANGDPINNYDPDGRFASAVYEAISYEGNIAFPLPTPVSLGIIEMINAPFNPSRIFDLSDLGRPELPNGLMMTFINGIWNRYGGARESAIYISDLCGGYNVHGVYGAVQFPPGGELLSGLLALAYIDTGRMKPLCALWDAHFKNHPDGYILHICHSRGAIDTRNALLIYPEELRKRIIVVAIAPAGYIYSETCARVTHYRADSPLSDPVPYIDGIGAMRERHTIVNLPPHPDSGWLAHGVTNILYRDYIEYEFAQFNEKRGK